MIKNDRQYRIIKARAERLERLAKDLKEKLRVEGDSARTELELRAVQSEFAQMSSDLDEYDRLKSGQIDVGSVASLDDIPRLLIRARIARNLTQAELAERLGLKEQQIQRYEATDYESANLVRLGQVADALEVDLVAPAPESEVPSFSTLVRFLEDQGLPREIVKARLAPITTHTKKPSVASVLSLAIRVGRVFGRDVHDLLTVKDSAFISPEPLVLGAFRARRGGHEAKLTAYAAYAHYLAVQTLRATPDLPSPAVSGSPDVLRRMIQERGGNFEATVASAWALGIPVLPLSDAGAFHGAYWRRQGRGVIVLKQRQRKLAIWWFDLLHELRHAAEAPEQMERERIEVSPMDEERQLSEEEQMANDFAAEVLFGDVAERLVSLVMAKSGGKPGLFKRTVQLVARREGVDVGALAYYIAHAAQTRGIDWWATATSLQPNDKDPWRICRDEYLSRVDLSCLDPIDQELLIRALSDPDSSAELASPRAARP